MSVGRVSLVLVPLRRVSLLLKCPMDGHPHYYYVRRTGILSMTVSLGRVSLVLGTVSLSP